MDKIDLNEFRKLLEDLKKEVLGNKIDLNDLYSEKLPDQLDIAAMDINQSLKTKLLKRRTLYIKKINESLARIEDGSYGECEWCGDDIAKKRLKARPTAKLCIFCKEDQEKEEKEKEMKGGLISNWEDEDSDSYSY